MNGTSYAMALEASKIESFLDKDKNIPRRFPFVFNGFPSLEQMPLD